MSDAVAQKPNGINLTTEAWNTILTWSTSLHYFSFSSAVRCSVCSCIRVRFFVLLMMNNSLWNILEQWWRYICSLKTNSKTISYVFVRLVFELNVIKFYGYRFAWILYTIIGNIRRHRCCCHFVYNIFWYD